MQTLPTHKVLLIILDGFGLRSETDFNAVTNAHTPNFDYFKQHYSFGKIDASGQNVGLPSGQFGNSEVGHLNIGAGRVVQQDITRIDNAIATGEFNTNQIFLNSINSTTSGCMHIMGLLSDGGVHSHINHIIALIKLVEAQPNIHRIWLHLFLDGRDTPPQSALTYIKQINQVLACSPKTKIATICGRFYAMDRDKRFNRIHLAYDAIMNGQADNHSDNVLDAINESYAVNLNDEFIKPCIFNGYIGVSDGDSMFFANFRSDRAIQLTEAITSKTYTNFICKPIELSSFVTMTQYDKTLKVAVAFMPNYIHNTLGEYISNLGLRQLRIAETEKYPHITYFFNGGRKEPYINEDRVLINSPRDVATYDEKPEMSLPEVTERLVNAINENKYDLIVTNFANGDMVGHSGNYEATIKAVNALDIALGKCVNAMQQIDGEILIIADHGNCENMFDYESNQPHTQHTTNFVPFLYIGRKATIDANGSLQDVAPTLLKMAGLNKPEEMTGHSLIKFI